MDHKSHDKFKKDYDAKHPQKANQTQVLLPLQYSPLCSFASKKFEAALNKFCFDHFGQNCQESYAILKSKSLVHFSRHFSLEKVVTITSLTRQLSKHYIKLHVLVS